MALQFMLLIVSLQVIGTVLSLLSKWYLAKERYEGWALGIASFSMFVIVYIIKDLPIFILQDFISVVLFTFGLFRDGYKRNVPAMLDKIVITFAAVGVIIIMFNIPFTFSAVSQMLVTALVLAAALLLAFSRIKTGWIVYLIGFTVAIPVFIFQGLHVIAGLTFISFCIALIKVLRLYGMFPEKYSRFLSVDK